MAKKENNLGNPSRRDFLKKGMAAALVAAVAGTGGYAILQSSQASSQVQQPFAQRPVISVGGLSDLSGYMQFYGVPINHAFQFAVKQLNDKGGVLGRQVQLLARDTQSSTAVCTAETRKLILDENVQFIFAGTNSDSREAARAIVDRYGGLLFYPVRYEGGVCDKWVFVTGETPAQQCSPLVDYGVKSFGKNVYGIYSDDLYGRNTAKWIESRVKSTGGEYLAQEFLLSDQADFTRLIARIKSLRPDFIIMAMLSESQMAFCQQWANAGLQGKIPLLTTTFGTGNEHKIVPPGIGRGTIACYNYFEEISSEANKKWVSEYRKMWPDELWINSLVENTWVSVMLWARAVEQAGTFEVDAVLKELESRISVDAPHGKVTMDPASHHAIQTMYLAQVDENAKWRIIEELGSIPPKDTQDVCNLILNPDQHKQYFPGF